MHTKLEIARAHTHTHTHTHTYTLSNPDSIDQLRKHDRHVLMFSMDATAPFSTSFQMLNPSRTSARKRAKHRGNQYRKKCYSHLLLKPQKPARINAYEAWRFDFSPTFDATTLAVSEKRETRKYMPCVVHSQNGPTK